MNLIVPRVRKTVPPDHNDLPETDGSIVENFQEYPQGELLTDSIRPVLDRLHSDGNYFIANDSGIYYWLTDPPLRGCKSPDWYYVPGRPPMLHGEMRRSYVLWQEMVAPLIAIEYVSGDGSEEHDATPEQGKFWVYERAIRIPYYAIFNGWDGTLEVYRLVDGAYQQMTPNERGRFLIPPLGVELGMWEATHAGMTGHWLRWWDQEGNLIPTSAERADIERGRAEQERQRAERLAEKLRALGVDPDAV
jgi:Uma2 family endonuclease